MSVGIDVLEAVIGYQMPNSNESNAMMVRQHLIKVVGRLPRCLQSFEDDAILLR